MKKIQITIAIYILVVMVVSIFFMPMDKVFMGSGDFKIELDAHRVFYTTGSQYLEGERFVFVPNIKIYKLYMSTISLVFLSIIAIHALELLKQKQISDNFKQLSLFDKD